MIGRFSILILTVALLGVSGCNAHYKTDDKTYRPLGHPPLTVTSRS